MSKELKDKDGFQETIKRLEEEKKELISSAATLRHKINNSLAGFLSLLSLLEAKDSQKMTIEGEDIYSLIKEEIDKIRELLKTFPPQSC